jgi:hypothetical protein
MTGRRRSSGGHESALLIKAYAVRGAILVTPPSTGIKVPVIKRASSLAGNNTAEATSEASPSIPDGATLRRSSRTSHTVSYAKRMLSNGVKINPGATVLTQMPARP